MTFSVRGAAPVGMLADLPSLEREAVVALRRWCEGGGQEMAAEFTSALGRQGEEEFLRLDRMFRALLGAARRPVMRHSLHCRCLGGDEAAIGQMIAAAAAGDQDDALRLAISFVPGHIAALAVSDAEVVGLTLQAISGETPDLLGLIAARGAQDGRTHH